MDILLQRSCILFLPLVMSTVCFLEAASSRPLKKFKPVSDGRALRPILGDSMLEVVLKLKCLASGLFLSNFLNS